MVFEVVVLNSDVSAFQALGTATMNALSAVWVLVLGMTKSPQLLHFRFSTRGGPSNSLIIINTLKDKSVFAYRFQLQLAI